MIGVGKSEYVNQHSQQKQEAGYIKGQLISIHFFETIVFPKKRTKYCKDFCPECQGRNPCNISFVFWEKRWLQKSVLRLTDLYYQLISTANPAKINSIEAELALFISWQIQSNQQQIFQFNRRHPAVKNAPLQNTYSGFLNRLSIKFSITFYHSSTR